MSSAIRAKAFQDGFKPYENLSIIRMGAYEESETAFLARGVNAAIAWSHTQAVQVVLDRKVALTDTKDDKAQLTYTIDEPPGNPRLRLVKVASTPFAKPGELVAFTIRFDNVGNQPIGNVVILDSLNTRLEYVPDSAQCSVDATFSTRPNEGESVVLSCELASRCPPAKAAFCASSAACGRRLLVVGQQRHEFPILTPSTQHPVRLVVRGGFGTARHV